LKFFSRGNNKLIDQVAFSHKKNTVTKVLLAEGVKFFNDQHGKVPSHSQYIIEPAGYLFSSSDITESIGKITTNGDR
jgi:hypothetical protein